MGTAVGPPLPCAWTWLQMFSRRPSSVQWWAAGPHHTYSTQQPPEWTTPQTEDINDDYVAMAN